jgi:hypothetical protein
MLSPSRCPNVLAAPALVVCGDGYFTINVDLLIQGRTRPQRRLTGGGRGRGSGEWSAGIIVIFVTVDVSVATGRAADCPGVRR